MDTWVAHIRRAFLLALAWGLAWAPLGVLAGMIIDSDGAMDEPWIAVGAYPGFLCALVFSILLALTDRRRGLDELPLARAAAWGALSGLILMVPIVAGLLGDPNTEHALWRGRFMIGGAVAALSAVSAVVSVLVAVKAKRPQLREGGARTV